MLVYTALPHLFSKRLHMIGFLILYNGVLYLGSWGGVGGGSRAFFKFGSLREGNNIATRSLGVH